MPAHDTSLSGPADTGGTATTAPLTGRARARLFARDFGIVVVVMVVYFILRGQAPGHDTFAFHFTDNLVKFEKWLHVFWEPDIQKWSIKYHWSRETANFIYAYGHFPALATVGVWLWFRGRNRFMLLRNTLFVSMVIGLLFYYTLPAAPPRLMAEHGYHYGFVDTIFGGHTAVDYAQPSLIRNDFAAIPSFHFGWIAVCTAAVWANTRNKWLWILAFLMSAIMGWAIVATANHLIIDMVVGLIVLVGSWYVALRIQWRSEARAAASIATRTAPRGSPPPSIVSRSNEADVPAQPNSDEPKNSDASTASAAPPPGVDE